MSVVAELLSFMVIGACFGVLAALAYFAPVSMVRNYNARQLDRDLPDFERSRTHTNPPPKTKAPLAMREDYCSCGGLLLFGVEHRCRR